MSKYLRKGDEVVVIAGNDRGKTGKILSFPCDSKVVVEGVNVRKKHMKRTQQNQKGQIIDIERAINISNIKPSVDGKGVKLRVRTGKEKQKELYFVSDDKQILYRPAKKGK